MHLARLTQAFSTPRYLERWLSAAGGHTAPAGAALSRANTHLQVTLVFAFGILLDKRDRKLTIASDCDKKRRRCPKMSSSLNNRNWVGIEFHVTVKWR